MSRPFAWVATALGGVLSLAALGLFMAILVEWPRAVPCALMGGAVSFIGTLAWAFADERRIASYASLVPAQSGEIVMPAQYTAWETAFFRRKGYLSPAIVAPSDDDLIAAENAWAADVAKSPRHTCNVAT